MLRLSKIFLFFVRLRYDIQLKGFEKVKSDQAYLVLPNHTSLLDPVILRSLFAPVVRLRPVATAYFAQNPFLAWIFRSIGAISIAETEKADTHLSSQLSSSLATLQSALQEQDSILLYPAGQLAGQGSEYIGGKKSAYLAVQEAPSSTQILTVRVSGLWGSIWSNARDGQRPSLVKNLLLAIWYFFANGFVFAPKRQILIEIYDQTEQLKSLSTGNLQFFNQHLEAFYNQHGEEQVSYLPHYFYFNDTQKRQLPTEIRNSIAQLKSVATYDSTKFSPEVIAQVQSLLTQIKSLNSDQLTLDQHLLLDLYLDSLDMAELKNSILTTFPKASNTPILELKTVADLVAMAMGLTANDAVSFKSCDWQIDPNTQPQERMLDENLNILEHFRRQRQQDRKATQLYDQLLGMQTRSDVALKSLLIADYLQQIPGKHIGIMLPALGSTSLLLLATYLANKIPVMMNWTHPEPAFDHCVQFSQTQKILTSKTFFHKINIPRLSKYEFIFLEDLLKDIPLHRKLSALIRSRYFPIPKKLDPTAVVLYTSGSEALPKAVPLTHRNLITNLQGSLGILDIKHDERLLGYLPPFHSFGFTVNTVLPLVAGLRAVNTPDPNDSLTVAQLIAHAQPTLLATTPTFLRNLLNIASADQLSSLRYVITGGERASDSLFQKAKKLIPSAVILEGYGITECSPIITINTLQKQKKQSTGIAISNWNLVILDPETHLEKPPLQEGMIYFSAPSVFAGYQDPQLPSPFIQYQEQSYYQTWDLGYLDDEGFLYITWRLKRFLKLGGEMISLPFIESLLSAKFWNPELANLAVEGKETENWIQILLFTVDLELTLAEVNTYLRSQGVNNLIQIDEIKPIGALPLLWSGKIDYKILKSRC